MNKYQIEAYMGKHQAWNPYFDCLAWTNETRSTEESHREVVKIIMRHMN